MTILGRGDLSPRRRPRRRGPVLAAVVVLAALAAGGWYGWHRWHGSDRAAVTPRTCVTPTPAPSPLPAAQVTVVVLNATDKVGLAHQVAAALRTQGLRVRNVGNTKTRISGVAAISYGSASKAAALTLAEYVPGATLVPVATGAAGTVTLQIGPTFTALAAPSDVTAAHARDLASASPRPVVCTTP